MQGPIPPPNRRQLLLLAQGNWAAGDSRLRSGCRIRLHFWQGTFPGHSVAGTAGAEQQRARRLVGPLERGAALLAGEPDHGSAPSTATSSRTNLSSLLKRAAGIASSFLKYSATAPKTRA